ncbi:MAG: NERD domain-containing protein [Burkholderiaceae bacterium]|jgi:hypothetical protein|nr:NERD domain-containing protein [Burkholderiaceae bacterium]
MILKHADDQSARLRVLENLLPSPRLSAAQRQRLERDIERARLGTQGEKDAAYYIDFHFGASKNVVVLHDLRLRDGDRQAQIDHLLIDRVMQMTVVETKNFGADVEISEQGEFTLRYGNRRFGIESPIEQNERHISVLRAVTESLDLPSRFGLRLRPSYRSAIVFAPRAVIQRPRKRDTSSVLKADQFRGWWNNSIDDEGMLSSIASLTKLVSAETVQSLARDLLTLHRPADALALPAYLAPQPQAPRPVAPARAESASIPAPSSPPTPAVVPALTQSASAAAVVCAACGKPLSEKVQQFCRANSERFGGALLCYTHQRSRRA